MFISYYKVYYNIIYMFLIVTHKNKYAKLDELYHKTEQKIVIVELHLYNLW